MHDSGVLYKSTADNVSGGLGSANSSGHLAGENIQSASYNFTAMNMSTPPRPSGKTTMKSGSRTPMRGPSASARRSRSMGPTRSAEVERGGSLGAMQEQMAKMMAQQANEAGITVAGSASSQQFRNVAGFPVEATSTVIVLQLRGEVGGKLVAAPVTVDTKPLCSTCGKKNKPTSKFCAECGTALELI